MSSIGYWEEFAEVYGGQVMYFTKKVSEEEKGAYQEIKDETDNAVKSFLQSELKRKSSFQKKVLPPSPYCRFLLRVQVYFQPILFITLPNIVKHF
jgi:hypothetical protein